MKVIPFIVATLFANSLFGQETNTPLNHRIEFVQAGLFIHSISLPLNASNHFIGLNRLPGISAGIGLNIGKDQKKLDAKYLAAFSAYHQQNLHNGFELNNILLVQYRLLPGFYLEGGPGIGYLHTFEDAPVYPEPGRRIPAGQKLGKSADHDLDVVGNLCARHKKNRHCY